jgi:hypothetical protein
VRGLADDLRAAAVAARGAVEEIEAAKKAALFSIGEAHAEGFAVGEDLSVTDQQATDSPDELAARQAQAQTLAADIREKAAALAAADQDAAAKITSAATGLQDVSFEEGSGGIQLVDFKQSPGTEPDPKDPDTHPDYPNRKPNGKWAPGNSGIDGDAEAEQTFEEMRENGIPVISQEVRVQVTDPETGHTFTRYYDGLIPTDKPGQYVGIEHKLNQSPYPKAQRDFDARVQSGTPATGKLNGQPIEVVDVEVVRTQVEVPNGAGGSDTPVVPGGIPDKVIEAAPKGVPEWGTQVSPDDMEDAGFPFNVVERFRETFAPNKNDPDNWA